MSSSVAITYLGIIFGLLLMAVPVVVIVQFRLNLLRRLLFAFLRLVVASAFVAILAYVAVKTNNIAIECTLAFVFCIVSALFTIGKSRTKASRLFVPVMVGSLVSIIVLAFYTLFLIFGLNNPFVANLTVPVFGLIAGGIVGSNARAINVYYTGLRNHSQLYYYLLGNGSTHGEAVSYFVRRSLQACIIHTTKQISTVCFITAPDILLVAVMSGTDIITALALQVVFYIIILCASLLSTVITLFVARKYSFDKYEALNPVLRNQSTKIRESQDQSAKAVDSLTFTD